MDLTRECEALECKIRRLCQPPIYINPYVYNDSDYKVFVALIKKILNQIPVEAYQILIDENVFSGLYHFKDYEFYAIFYNYMEQNKNVIQQKSYYTLLAYEQWQKKTFCAMKMRIIGVFVDIIKAKLNARRYYNAKQLSQPKELPEEDRVKTQSPEASKEFYFRDFKFQPGKPPVAERTPRVQHTYARNYLPAPMVDVAEDAKQLDRMTDQLASAFGKQSQNAYDEVDYFERHRATQGDDILIYQKIFRVLERLDAKIDHLAARVESVEGTVKALWMELLK